MHPWKIVSLEGINITEYILESKHMFAHMHIAFKNKPAYTYGL